MNYKNLYKFSRTGQVDGYDPRLNILCSLIPEKNSAILDIGCNDGFVSKYLKKESNIVVGIEVNEELAKSAKGRIDKVIIQDLEERWQVEDQSFDIIYAGYVLEHIFDTDFILDECYRVLKPDGTLIISVPNIGYLLHRFELLFGKVPSWYRNKEHIRLWSKNSLALTLAERGFEPLKCLGTTVIQVPCITYLFRFFPTISSIIIYEFKKRD